MKKRGISQLIATVLIIVFVVAIALTIFSFAKKTATGETTKSGDKAVAQDVCRDKVKIRINNVDTKSDSTKLRIQVENFYFLLAIYILLLLLAHFQILHYLEIFEKLFFLKV